MEKRRVLFIISVLHIFTQGINNGFELKNFSLLMPDVISAKEESYFCTSAKIFPDQNFYIIAFEPVGTMETVHHMILFGCSKPETSHLFWDCEMADPCADSSSVIYAWALKAPLLQLPEDIGFLVGKGTDIKYLVLQIHYSKAFNKKESDNSGLNLLYTEEPQSKLAGVLVLGTGGVIPPNSVTHMEILCSIKEKKIIYPFAYRVHTHELGKAVSGYSIHRDGDGRDHWRLLGKYNPKKPQMFRTIFNKSLIRKGDRVAAKCIMDSNRSKYTIVGPKHHNEMCNFYIMYYVKKGTPLKMKYCISRGPPHFYWNNEANGLNNIPYEED